MAFGSTLDSLQAALMAEQDAQNREANGFRNYLLGLAQNRVNNRLAGTSQYGAETNRALGTRAADATDAEREMRYRQLAEAMAVQDRQFTGDLALRGELGRGNLALGGRQADNQATETQRRYDTMLKAMQEDTARANIADATARVVAQNQRDIGMGQVGNQGRQVDVNFLSTMIGPRQSEGYILQKQAMDAERAAMIQQAQTLADTLNRRTRMTKDKFFRGGGPLSDNELDSVLEAILLNPENTKVFPFLQQDQNNVWSVRPMAGVQEPVPQAPIGLQTPTVEQQSLSPAQRAARTASGPSFLEMVINAAKNPGTVGAGFYPASNFQFPSSQIAPVQTNTGPMAPVRNRFIYDPTTGGGLPP